MARKTKDSRLKKKFQRHPTTWAFVFTLVVVGGVMAVMHHYEPSDWHPAPAAALQKAPNP